MGDSTQEQTRQVQKRIVTKNIGENMNDGPENN